MPACLQPQSGAQIDAPAVIVGPRAGEIAPNVDAILERLTRPGRIASIGANLTLAQQCVAKKSLVRGHIRAVRDEVRPEVKSFLNRRARALQLALLAQDACKRI